MNPKQILMNQLQMQIKSRNPQLLEQFTQLQNQNPQEVLNQIMNKYTPEQKANFVKYASGFGVSEEQLKNYGINS